MVKFSKDVITTDVLNSGADRDVYVGNHDIMPNAAETEALVYINNTLRLTINQAGWEKYKANVQNISNGLFTSIG